MQCIYINVHVNYDVCLRSYLAHFYENVSQLEILLMLCELETTVKKNETMDEIMGTQGATSTMTFCFIQLYFFDFNK